MTAMKKKIILLATCLMAIINTISAEDKVSINDFIISAGETKEIDITLDNDAAYVAFQFDLYLPDGITVENYSASSDRIPKNTTLNMSRQTDGSYRFISAAMRKETIVGNSGTIISLTVKAADNLASSDYTCFFRHVKLSKVDATGPTYSEMSFPLTIVEPSIVTIVNVSREYGEANPVFEYTVEGPALSGEPQITCEATVDSPVGTYDIVADKGSVTNYKVVFIAGTLTVTKAPLNISVGGYTKKQGESLPEFMLIYEGFKNNETKDVLTKQPEISCNATNVSKPSEYPIIVSGAEAQNYEISYSNGVLTVTMAGKMGDANIDGEIDVTDVVLMIDDILGKTPDKYNAFLADVNDDGVVDVTDVVLVIDVILGKITLPDSAPSNLTSF
jgi:hypothetical protein